MKNFQIGLMGVSLTVSAFSLAASGELDPSFGDDADGKTSIAFDVGGNDADTPRSMVLDSAGNIVVGGSASTDSGSKMAMARLTANGLPDYSFYPGGYRRTYSPVDAGAAGYSLVATSNGLCLAGSSIGAFSSNAHTACFDGNQVLAHSIDAAEQMFGWTAATTNSWTIFGNDFFYVAGPKGIGDNEDFAVARLHLNSVALTLDPAFGQNGYASHSLNSDRHRINAVALLEDHGLYLAGCSIGGANKNFAVVKLLSSGDPDTAFDENGQRHQLFDLGGNFFDDCAAAMAIDAQDRLLLAGTATRNLDGTDLDIALTRLLPNGDDDPSFGPEGKRVYSFSTLDPTLKDEVAGLAIDSYGRIYVVGTLYHADQQDDLSDVAVMRLKPDGEIDTSFGTEGRVLFSAPYYAGCALPPVSAEKGIAIVMQESKPVILAERRACNSDTDFMVMRLLPGDGLFADGFEGP